MENKRSSHRRRKALDDLVARTGVNRREAGRILDGHTGGSQLHPEDVVWVTAPDLSRLIDDVVNNCERGLAVDTYTPIEFVEGHIEEQLLTGFRTHGIHAEDAYIENPEDPATIDCDLVAVGAGDVDWHVTQPTAGDMHAYGSVMEGLENGPGLWQGSETAAPIRVRVHARYITTSTRWIVEDIRSVDLEEEEASRRFADHELEDTRRQQALGLLPSDDELNEMSERAHREHVEHLIEHVESLLEGIQEDVLRPDFLPGEVSWTIDAVEEPKSDDGEGTRAVIAARLQISGGGRKDQLEQLKEWIEQDTSKAQVGLERWVRHDGEGGAPIADAVFVYEPKFVRGHSADVGRR